MPCFPATVQAPAKSFLRPSTWLPGVKEFHAHTERWKIETDPDHCIDELLVAIEHLNETEHPSEYYVNKVRHQDHWLQIYAYTPTGWLDILEIAFISYGNGHSLAKVSSFSTGVLPAWIPFGFLCDVLLCWCPFSDGGANAYRCQIVRECLPFQVTVLSENEKDRLLPQQNHTTHSMAQRKMYDKETNKNK